MKLLLLALLLTLSANAFGPEGIYDDKPDMTGPINGPINGPIYGPLNP